MSLVRLIAIVTFSFFNVFNCIETAFAEELNESLESQVKSAYIFKFCNYITWPETAFAEPASPIVIGVVGSELIANELEKIAANRLSGNRRVVIKRLDVTVIHSMVHILYLSNHYSKYMDSYRNALQMPPTLYITDTLEGLSFGSVINFVRDNDRVRFDISLKAAEQNKIKLDGSLLTVARNVLLQ
jgi:uncharacterized protein DUF4154